MSVYAEQLVLAQNLATPFVPETPLWHASNSLLFDPAVYSGPGPAAEPTRGQLLADVVAAANRNDPAFSMTANVARGLDGDNQGYEKLDLVGLKPPTPYVRPQGAANQFRSAARPQKDWGKLSAAFAATREARQNIGTESTPKVAEKPTTAEEAPTVVLGEAPLAAAAVARTVQPHEVKNHRRPSELGTMLSEGIVAVKGLVAAGISKLISARPERKRSEFKYQPRHRLPVPA